MPAERITYAKNSHELKEAILHILKAYRERDGYVADRNRCINFGSIFQDGIASYSNIDLFCERIFLPNITTMLTKTVHYIKDEDQEIVNKYNTAKSLMERAAVNPESVSEEEIVQSKQAIEETEPLLPKIEPESKEVEIPFYVNSLTKEEFPLVPLKEVSDENLDSWSAELSKFIEVSKAVLTPAAFSPVQQPDGLSVMEIKSPLWSDIVVR